MNTDLFPPFVHLIYISPIPAFDILNSVHDPHQVMPSLSPV